MIPAHAIERVKRAVDFPALVASYTPLRKSGAQWLVLCPFHRDRRPSCRIYSDHYHCFTCNAHGSPLSWVVRLEALSFPAAIKYLAERVGVSLEETRPPTRLQLAYAREEAAICEWWWKCWRERLIAQANNEPDWDFAETIGRLTGITLGPTERFTVFRALVTATERRQYKDWRQSEDLWLTTWLLYHDLKLIRGGA